jgi:hypothetical protein
MSLHRIAEDTLVQTSTGVREIQSLHQHHLASNAISYKMAIPYVKLCHSFGNTVSEIDMVSHEETTRCVRIVTRSGMTLTCSPDTKVLAIDLRTTATSLTPLSHITVHHDLIGVVTNKHPCVPYNFRLACSLDSSPYPFSYADLMNSESEEQGYTVAHNIFWGLRENDNSGPLIVSLPSRRYAQAVSIIASQMGCISRISQDDDMFTAHIYPMHKLSLLYRTLWGSNPNKGFNFNTPYPKLHDTVWTHSLHKCVSMRDLTPYPQVCTIIEALEGGRLRLDKPNPFPLLYADSVVCVRGTVPRPVYSITSKDCPAFIANGFIVKM